MAATDEYVIPNETYDWDAVRARLEKQAEEGFPPAWQPEGPGESLFGVVRRVTMQAPTSYGPSPVVEVETPEHARFSVWLYHTVLRRSFERERVCLGETVLIRYEGKRYPEGGGNSYDDYRLVVDRANVSGEPDWGAMAERYGDGPLDEMGARPADPGPPADLPDYGDDDIPF